VHSLDAHRAKANFHIPIYQRL